MPKVSFLIPARNEIYLEPTIKSLLDNCKGDIEIIVVLDGYIPDPPIILNDDRVIFLYYKESIGQRAAINEAAKIATGDFLCKLDAHCCVDEGFDVKLAADCEYGWTVIPRMKNLDPDTFMPRFHDDEELAFRKGKIVDYMYMGIEKGELRTLYYPWKVSQKMHKERKDILIDETMSCQGCCYSMHKDRYWELGGAMEEHGSWGNQGIEIAAGTWLSGGKLIVNKKTWFAHLWRKEHPFPLSGKQVEAARKYSWDLWINNKWPKAVHTFQWLVDKFNPPGWNSDRPEGRWYQEAVINGVEMPVERSNDTSEKRWQKYIMPFVQLGNGIFLDLGCNAGFYSRKMIDFGYHCIGVEKDLKYFAHAKYWEEKMPKGVELINKDITEYDIPYASYVLLANVHYWLTVSEFNELRQKLLKKAARVIVVGRNKDHESHKSNSDYITLTYCFIDWKEKDHIKGEKHYSVCYENPKFQIHNVEELIKKQQCFKSKRFLPSFKKMILEGDNTEYYEYLKWRGFKDPESILIAHRKLINSVYENGIVDPLIIEGEKVVNGDHRLIIAYVSGFKTVLCKVKEPEDNLNDGWQDG
jgi:glycosyltransferase involved in cell wall biosynthesis